VAAGRHLVEEALRAGCCRRLWGTPEGLAALEIPPGVPVQPATAEAMERICGAARGQGVAAEVAPAPAPPRAWPWYRGPALHLGRVSDPVNLGLALRAAWALGAAGVGLAPGSVDPLHPVALRRSAGAVFHLPWLREISPEDLLAHAPGGTRAWLLEAGADTPVHRAEAGLPALLLLGGEAGFRDRPEGIPALSLPLAAGVDSLNLAAAAALALHEWRRPQMS